MAAGPIRKAVDKSVKAAVKDGRLDSERHAAPIAMLRSMADYLDVPSADTPSFRYVTPASFLAYCDRLGLAPDLDAAKAKARADGEAEAPKGGSMDTMRGKFRAYEGGKSA